MVRVPGGRSGLRSIVPFLVSGILLGISFPTYPFVRLEILAWIALVPLLLASRREGAFAGYAARVYLTMLVFGSISVWWISLATLAGGILAILVNSFFMTVPLLVFFVLRRRRGYRFALYSLPFLWVFWEWLYMSQDLSFGWLLLGNSQALLNPMIQYVDITGVWGVSFWLLWFNVLVADGIDRYENGRAVLPGALFVAAMLAVPPAYAWWIYSAGEAREDLSPVKVAIVQPNIDPLKKWKLYDGADIMTMYYAMTDALVFRSKPDLVLWPETAIPFYIREAGSGDYYRALENRARQWDAALLSGCADIVWYSDEEVAGKELLYRYDRESGRYYQTFNASMLIDGKRQVPQMYRKMKLVPFAERVPYMEYAPWLGNLTFSLAGISSWGKGGDMTIMEFTTARGDTVRISNVICYESIFPGLVADFVGRGSEFLTLVTNDGWYAKSYGPYQHAAIARFRCIENRRAMARCANTGISLFLDRFGRVSSEIPWWEKRTLVADIERSRALTFYTRFPDLLPRVAGGISLFIVLLAAFPLKRRRRARNF